MSFGLNLTHIGLKVEDRKVRSSTVAVVVCKVRLSTEAAVDDHILVKTKVFLLTKLSETLQQLRHTCLKKCCSAQTFESKNEPSHPFFLFTMQLKLVLPFLFANFCIFSESANLERIMDFLSEHTG